VKSAVQKILRHYCFFSIIIFNRTCSGGSMKLSHKYLSSTTQVRFHKIQAKRFPCLFFKLYEILTSSSGINAPSVRFTLRLCNCVE